MTKPTSQIIHGDCLEVMKAMPSKSVDLVLGSPPYENARTYGINFNVRGEAWVAWMLERMTEMVRVSRGLVVMVVEGKTKDYEWSATPALLMADLKRAGICLRKPPIFHRIGIPGSGGNRDQHAAIGGSADWFRNDYEFLVCCTESPGKLPWADTLALGHPPRWAPGGAMSNRTADGRRINDQLSKRTRDIYGFTPHDGEPSQTQRASGKRRKGTASRGGKNGDIQTVSECYDPPAIANPGNCFQETYTASEVVALLQEAGDVRHYIVGGGVMGSKLAHENEAPFPEALARDYCLCFVPPGGKVLDPFVGSGTTPKVALQLGRNAIGIDVRESQVELSGRRIKEAK